MNHIDALRKIAELQPEMLETLRSHGVVFNDIGTDPQNWQHIAFSIYTTLCEADMIARRALAEDE
jgi:lactam utilization protein B